MARVKVCEGPLYNKKLGGMEAKIIRYSRDGAENGVLGPFVVCRFDEKVSEGDHSHGMTDYDVYFSGCTSGYLPSEKTPLSLLQPMDDEAARILFEELRD